MRQILQLSKRKACNSNQYVGRVFDELEGRPSRLLILKFFPNLTVMDFADAFKGNTKFLLFEVVSWISLSFRVRFDTRPV